MLAFDSLNQRSVRNQINKFPYPIDSIFLNGFKNYYYGRLKIVSLKESLRYDAPLWPTQLYYISPKKIYLGKKPSVSLKGTYVKGGDWDKKQSPFKKCEVYEFFVDWLEEGTPLQNTKYYNKKINKIKNGKSDTGCRTVECMNNVFDEYKKIFQEIRNEGYKSQKYLRTKDDKNINPGAKLYPPELDEVAVDISRDGTFLWAAGQYRVSMAMINNINKIPVRIRCRHKKWQEVRDDIYNNGFSEEYNKELQNHPDIQKISRSHREPHDLLQ